MDKSAVDQVKIMKKNDREVIYIPMVHVGKPEYYKEVKSYVDSLRTKGYKVYYEGLSYSENSTDNEKKLLKLKMRKLLRINISGGYDNLENETLPKWFKNGKYVAQTLENIGINPKIDFNADMTYNDLIDSIEINYGKVELSDCDFNTPLYDKYKCKKDFKGSAVYSVTQKFRNELLKDILLNSNDKKIVLLYGKRHWIHGIYPDLVVQNNFKLIKGKI